MQIEFGTDYNSFFLNYLMQIYIWEKSNYQQQNNFRIDVH